MPFIPDNDDEEYFDLDNEDILDYEEEEEDQDDWSSDYEDDITQESLTSKYSWDAIVVEEPTRSSFTVCKSLDEQGKESYESLGPTSRVVTKIVSELDSDALKVPANNFESIPSDTWEKLKGPNHSWHNL